MTQPLLQAADLRGAARLTTDAVAGLASLVEAMHARIVTLPRIPGLGDAIGADERTRGVSGLVYKTVRGVNRLAGGTLDALLGWLAPALAAADPQQAPRPEREAILAALNGVLGDHLATTDNPLAIAMRFRHSGRPLPLERHALRSRLGAATPKLLVLLHGLCMNDLQWHRAGHDHGEALARDLGYTPVYLHYNSGLSISTNGRILARLMESLYSVWPVPIERLTLIGHSMGGLVARSAIHHGALMERGGLRWPGRVDDLVCLGTPHHGAPLERVGHGLDLLLGAAPYAAPLARLGKVRSAGIRDLRLGNILKGPAGDDGTHRADSIALPSSARCFAIAASLGPAPGRRRVGFLGDGLVPIASALGRHDNADLDLGIPPAHQAVVHDTSHLDLLSSTEVAALLRQWLS
ncbi:esterase/lipase family protein [Roseateles violae]|uniref:Alpha/beta hydrolase n=1 Tax=Roseateles violae TaxID=3058042 RepID=A0ABT8DRT2_9BURK|nr:alpha/beta hydrolase [Pelomonas sp. PFR6]MDN3920768.1 alpha/beta hydrolase [Pelomonas sp. PFR6]